MLSWSPAQSHREHFFDPFSAGNPVVTDKHQHQFLKVSPVHNGVDPILRGIPVYKEDNFDLSIKGQGVIVVQAKKATAVTFVIDTVNKGPSLYVNVTEDTIDFSYGDPGKVPTQLVDVMKPDKTTPAGKMACTMKRKFLRPDKEATYWLSIDQSHGWLRYGKDYTTSDRTIAQVNLKYKDVKKGVWVWDKPEYKMFEEWMHVHLTTTSSMADAPPALKSVYPMPIVDDLSPYLISDQKVTLAQLATGVMTVPQNLSAECQLLYANVAGPSITLDTDDDGDFVFSEAIERSVNTPGLIGYEKLKEKVGELGDDFEGTYLRITLGLDKGDSPGIPYVLEIWPAGHYSPIHDHGKAFAVIKVLHGNIQATYYDSLDLPVNQLGPAAHLQKGDITWLSPSNYQVHKLHNTNTEGQVCCTIQCYKYGTDDMEHYKYFNYLADVDGKKPSIVEQFEPNSDWDFLDFVKLIREEWDKRPRDKFQKIKNTVGTIVYN